MQIAADRPTASRSTRLAAARSHGPAPRGGGRLPPGPRAAAALAAPGSAGAAAANAQVLAELLAGARLPGPAREPEQTSNEGPERRVGDDELATRPATAATSENRPELEALADNPVVDAAIAADWTASNPNGPGAKQERGFWVLRAGDGTISVQAFPSNGTRDSLRPGPMPATAIAFFHTHPNTVAEGYAQEPSTADRNFAAARGIPGLVMSHAGMFYFGPALP